MKTRASVESSLSDLLNFAHFVDDGIIINKDGAYLMAYQFRGEDSHSATLQELNALAVNFNRLMLLLEDGWMVHVDVLRLPSLTYPEQGYFPDPVSKLIDQAQRQAYEAFDAHYENLHFITFVWKFPLPIVKNLTPLFVEGEKEMAEPNLTKLLNYFKETVERCIGLVNSQLRLTPLNSAELLSYLSSCITGELLPVAVPFDGCFLDVVLARKNLSVGYIPKIGEQSVLVLSIIGYLNQNTIPGLLEHLSLYPALYRWSNRFVPLSEDTARKEMHYHQKNWNNKVKGFFGIIKEVISGKPTFKINNDAAQMSAEIDEAFTLNSNHSTRFGFWTSEIILMHEKVDVLHAAQKDILRYLEQAGFTCVKEDVNAFDAWLGSIPGHGSCNVRRVFLNAMNVAHVLPLNSIWAGEKEASSYSLLPKHSSPVFYANTSGKTPFRFHMDVKDVGHMLVLGPTGSGKSTFLGFLIAQFLRYKEAQIFVFDKDESHKALTFSLSGHHYDIGKEETFSFCPLANLNTDSQKTRAELFIEELLILQNVILTPAIHLAVHEAIELLSASPQHNRNLTIFRSLVQHNEVRDALHYYTVDGQIKLLDATSDSLQQGHLQTFEMNWLLNQTPKVYLPVLSYLLNEIESRLEKDVTRPTLIILEEAWNYLSHELFSKRLRDWLKTLRKKNARVVFATQSLSDLYDPTTQSLTQTTAVLIESCPTKVYLANQMMDAEGKLLYQKMGLSERQIEIIAKVAMPKQHYYVTSPEGNRLIDLNFNERSLALSFIGLSKQKSQALLSCQQQHPNDWLSHWLQQSDQSHWKKFLKEEI